MVIKYTRPDGDLMIAHSNLHVCSMDAIVGELVGRSLDAARAVVRDLPSSDGNQAAGKQ